jgi:hypothetical protein
MNPVLPAVKFLPPSLSNVLIGLAWSSTFSTRIKAGHILDRQLKAIDPRGLLPAGSSLHSPGPIWVGRPDAATLYHRSILPACGTTWISPLTQLPCRPRAKGLYLYREWVGYNSGITAFCTVGLHGLDGAQLHFLPSCSSCWNWLRECRLHHGLRRCRPSTGRQPKKIKFSLD